MLSDGKSEDGRSSPKLPPTCRCKMTNLGTSHWRARRPGIPPFRAEVLAQRPGIPMGGLEDSGIPVQYRAHSSSVNFHAPKRTGAHPLASLWPKRVVREWLHIDLARRACEVRDASAAYALPPPHYVPSLCDRRFGAGSIISTAVSATQPVHGTAAQIAGGPECTPTHPL